MEHNHQCAAQKKSSSFIEEQAVARSRVAQEDVLCQAN